jgi:hypothetical protein
LVSPINFIFPAPSASSMAIRPPNIGAVIWTESDENIADQTKFAPVNSPNAPFVSPCPARALSAIMAVSHL